MLKIVLKTENCSCGCSGMRLNIVDNTATATVGPCEKDGGVARLAMILARWDSGDLLVRTT
jgi:hypothetical protein